MRLQLLAPLLAGGVVVIVAFGYGLAWLLLHDVDRLIDLGDLTVDRDGATVEETLVRIEPYRKAADEACALTENRGCGAESCACDQCVQADIAELGCDCDDCLFWALAVAEKQQWGTS